MAKEPTSTSPKRSREEDLERKERKAAKKRRKEEKRRKKEAEEKQSEVASEKDDDSAERKRRKEEKKARKLAKEAAHQSQSTTSSTPSKPAATGPASSPARANTAASPPKGSPSLPWTAPSFFPGTPGYSAKPTGGFNPSDFPPGFDFSALTAHLSPNEPGSSSQSGAGAGAAGSSSQSRDAAIARLTELTAAPGFTDTVVRAPRRGVTAADLDRVLLTSGGGGGRSGGPFGRVGGTRNKENVANSKEATIADAQGLTEKEILSQKLYQPFQLKWLEEAGILTKVYRGKFSQKEIETMTEALRRWCASNGLSFDEGKALLNDRNSAQVELYANLTQELAASLEGRPLRSVRRLAKETFHPDHNKGAWSEEDVAQLALAYEHLGPKWKLIGEKLGRMARDVRCRYRDYGTSMTRKGGGKWTPEEEAALEAAVIEQCQQLGLDPTDKGLPWKAIAAKISKTTAPNACLLKWGQMLGKRQRAEESAGRSKVERYRDEEKLLRLLMQQTPALERDSEEAIDWSAVAQSFLFDRFRVSKAWKRLVKAHLPPEKKSAPLREKLEVLLPIVEAQLKRYDEKERARREKAEARAKEREEKGGKEKSKKRRKVAGADGEQEAVVDLADQIGSDDEL